jgi:hypothetical protein
LGAFACRRLARPVIFAVLTAVASLGVAPAADADTKPSFTSGPAIVGPALVGSTLAVAATWTGDPYPTIKYTWGRCPPTSTTCTVIKGEENVQYAVTASDLGYRLAAVVEIKNKAGSLKVTTAPTAVVTTPSAPPPPPPPPPPPEPDPDPLPPPPPVTIVPTSASAPSAVAAPRPALMRPFPVVRIRGYFAARGARITLLSVRGPRTARISVRCVGSGCPLATLSLPSAPARLHPFERFLPAGTRLQVRVARPGRIGKYTSFLIRARRAPLRTDRCLLPGGSRPMRCPAS